MSRLERLGRTAARHPWRVIGTWLAAAALLMVGGQVAGGAFVNDFGIPHAESERAVDLARAHVPGVGASSADIVLHRSSGSLRDPDAAAAVSAMVAQIRSQPDVASVTDPLLPPAAGGGGVVSPDGRTALTSVQYRTALGDIDPQAADRLLGSAAGPRAAGVQVEFRGQVIDRASEPKTGGGEFIGVGVALVVLLLTFGSLVAAALPIAVAVVGLAAASALVLLVGAVIDIPTSAPIVAVMLGLGAGIDYALFVLTAYRHRLAAGVEPVTAVGQAMASAGHAVIFAGATVVVAIFGLLLAGIPFIGSIGIAAALTVTVMVLAAVTLLPALLGLLGRRVNAGRVRFGRRPAGGRPGPGRWRAWSTHVDRHRVAYGLVSLAVMLALAAPVLSLRAGTPDDSNGSAERTQRRAYDLIAANLGPGWNGPLLVVVEQPGPSGRAAVEQLQQRLRSDPAVASVTPPVPSPDGRVVLLTAVPREGPQSRSVSDLVHRLRETVGPEAVRGQPGVEVAVGGPTAYLIDLADVVGRRLGWVLGAVVLAGAVLLLALFRAPLIALKAALMALLSVGAAYGVLVMAAQWGWGLAVIGLAEPVPIMSVVLLLLFAVLFGLSMDYEVFLLSATRQAYEETGDPREAVATGLAYSGRVITAAAAIMAAVFLSFLGVDDVFVKLTGLGLATAVIVDATLLRVVLGPAVLSLLGRTAWWPYRGRPGPPAAGGPAVDGPAAGGPAAGGPAADGPAAGGPAVGGRRAGGAAPRRPGAGTLARRRVPLPDGPDAPGAGR